MCVGSCVIVIPEE